MAIPESLCEYRQKWKISSWNRCSSRAVGIVGDFMSLLCGNVVLGLPLELNACHVCVQTLKRLSK